MKSRTLYINLIFSVLLVGLFLLLFYIRDIKFEVHADDYFPEDEKTLNDYREFNRVFDKNPDRTIGILIVANNSLYDSIFLKKLKTTIKNLEAQPERARVKSLFNLRRPQILLNAFIDLPIIHPNSPEKYSSDSIEVAKNKLLTADFIGSNQKSTFLIIRLNEHLDRSQVIKTIESLKSILRAQNFKEYYFIGRPFIEYTVSQLMLEELKYLGAFLVLVMILLMILIFRSFVLVLITFGIVIFSLGIIYGIYGFFGFRLEVLSNILPVLIILFSINNCVHIYKKYQNEVNLNPKGEMAGIKVVQEKFPDIILANLTTALGFGSLCFSVLPAMKHFGLYAVIAICSTLIVNLICFSFLFMRPFFINTMKISSAKPVQSFSWYTIVYTKFLSSKIWRVGAAIVSIIILLGIFKIDTNAKKLTNLPDTEGLKTGIVKYGNAYGGANGFDILIRANQKENATYKDVLVAADSITKLLMNLGMNNVKSVAQVQEYIYTRFGKSDLKMGEAGSVRLNLYNTTEKVGRISGRVNDLGRIDRRAVEDNLQPLLTSLASKYNLEFVFTGEDHLNDLAHSYRIKEMFSGLILSIGIVSLLILVRFKSLYYFFISLLANLLPLLFIAGLMGWLRIELRGSTSILFTIGFAIAVDDTIHFLSELKRNRKKAFTMKESVLDTLRNVGSPIYLSSLILSIGFFVLLFSKLWDLAIFGLLIGLFILAAMLCDLVILPLILSYKIKNNG